MDWIHNSAYNTYNRTYFVWVLKRLIMDIRFEWLLANANLHSKIWQSIAKEWAKTPQEDRAEVLENLAKETFQLN